MKKVEHYICDICHTEYNNKLTCQNCEKTHEEPIKVVNAKYISYTQTGYGKGNYPVWIDVEFKDGKIRRYKQ